MTRWRSTPLSAPFLWLASSCAMYGPDLLSGAGQESTNGTGGGPVGGAGGTVDVPTGGGAPSVGGTAASVGGQANTGGSAGAPGSAGGTTAALDCAFPQAGIFSDFESGTAIVSPEDGRSGNWFLFNDGSGAQLPEKPSSGPFDTSTVGVCGSSYAFETTGTGFTGWGAGLGADLAPKISGIKQAYDLSAYAGFSFYARAHEALVLRVSWSDENTAPEGGVCNPDAQSGDPDRCGDYFGIDVVLGPVWERFDVRFAELTQRGFGLSIPEGFDAATAYSFRAQTSAADFSFAVDEIRFF